MRVWGFDMGYGASPFQGRKRRLFMTIPHTQTGLAPGTGYLNCSSALHGLAPCAYHTRLARPDGSNIVFWSFHA